MLTLLSFLTSTASADRWVVTQTIGNARVYSQVPVNTPALRSHLNNVAREFKTITKLADEPPTVEIVIFRTPTAYRNHLRGKIGQLGNRRAIFYRNGDVFQVYAIAHSQLTTDIRHEYTHALLHYNLPYVPLWIDEGMAEYLETPQQHRAGASRLKAVRWKARTGWSPKLPQLERIPSAEAMTSDNYRDSWAWIHYLATHSDDSRQHLMSFLQAIDSGAAPGNFSEYLSKRNPTIAQGSGSYFRRLRFSLSSGSRQ